MADDSNIIGQVASGNAPQPAADAASTVDYSKVADETVKAMDANTDGTEDLDLGDEDSIDEAQATGEISKKEAQSLKKKLKLKVDGREFEEEVDLGDEAYLTRELQKSKAFDKRMQEFAEYKKKVDAFMNAFNEDPEGLLEKMGKNVDERLEKKRIQEEKERQEIEALRNQHAMELERDIKQALENADTVLPKRSPLVMHRIGQALFLAMKSGYPNVKVKDVIPLVEKQYKQELSELFKVMPEDTIEALIGKEPLHKWRKSLIAKNKAAKVQADVPSKGKIEDTGNKQRNEPTAEPKRFKDFFKYND
jgi:hypothetical protein